jgi:hypothetical protein
LVAVQGIIDKLEVIDRTLLAKLKQYAGEQLEINDFIPFLKNVSPTGDDDSTHYWDYLGTAILWCGAPHEALVIHWEHYQLLLARQEKSKTRVHKGTPLVRISDCFRSLGFTIHTKRYLMLTLCEDAIDGVGKISSTAGVYPRLLAGGLAETSLEAYAKKIFNLSKKLGSFFPEAVLQSLDDDWLTEFPSPQEASFYRINPPYVRHSVEKLPKDRSGKDLERLAGYLMSCMPGCRTRALRSKSTTTDYDVVCAMEGFELDFRSEFGRYFLCECKAWKKPANFTTMAKFGRILDSTKARFGILFSNKGLTGRNKRRDAEAEQINFFHDTGKVIVVVNLQDLEAIARGENLIALLRNRYEKVRLSLTRELVSTETKSR